MVAPLPELVSKAAKYQPIGYVEYREFLFPKTGKLPGRLNDIALFLHRGRFFFTDETCKCSTLVTNFQRVVYNVFNTNICGLFLSCKNVLHNYSIMWLAHITEEFQSDVLATALFESYDVITAHCIVQRCLDVSKSFYFCTCS